jgi:glutamyl-tRNA reductase
LSRLGTALARALPEQWRVFTAPGSEAKDMFAAVGEILASGARSLVVIPASPHFSASGTGRALSALYHELGRRGEQLDVTVHGHWHDDGGYVSALARHVAEEVSALGLEPEEAVLRFVAPRPAPSGARDVYAAQLRRTVELVAERLGWPAHRLSLEWDGAAHMAGVPWRRSESTEEDGGHATRPCTVLVCPLLCLAPARPWDGRVRVCAPLDTYAPFIAALKRLVLKGPRPVPLGKRPPAPLLPPLSPTRRRVAPAALFMLGTSVSGGVGAGEGPALLGSDPAVFARARKSHAELGTFLDWLRESTPVQEAFVWSTCQRVELYAWLPEAVADAERAGLLDRIGRALYGPGTPGLERNVLGPDAAHHHILRTACGLNSDLPGDRDVAAQLQTALRRAQSAGTAAGRATALVDEAVAVAADLAARTAWGRFATGYCAAALERIFEVTGLMPEALRHVTIGGSTTSRSVLACLTRDHRVPAPQLTAIYRDHHGQMKELRTALANGRRLRVHAYGDARVLRALSDADVVYFGIDQPEPVLDLASLTEMRDLSARPLTLVDFNSGTSVRFARALEGVTVWDAQDLDHAVATHAAITTTRDGFADAVAEVETRIAEHLAALRDGSAPTAHVSGSAVPE